MNLNALIVAVVGVVVLIVAFYIAEYIRSKRAAAKSTPEPGYPDIIPEETVSERGYPYQYRKRPGTSWFDCKEIVREFPNGSFEIKLPGGNQMRKKAKNVRETPCVQTIENAS